MEIKYRPEEYMFDLHRTTNLLKKLPETRTFQSSLQKLTGLIQKTSRNSDQSKEEFSWNRAYRAQHPLKTAGVATALAGRYVYCGMFAYAFYHKATHKWMWTNALQQHFRNRLNDLAPNSFQARYLRRFGIPCYGPIAWFVTVGQCSITVSSLLGVGVRPNATLGLFMLLNFIAGGYGNPSIAPFVALSLMLMATPNGRWMGLDKRLHQKYPQAIWFR